MGCLRSCVPEEPLIDGRGGGVLVPIYMYIYRDWLIREGKTKPCVGGPLDPRLLALALRHCGLTFRSLC